MTCQELHPIPFQLSVATSDTARAEVPGSPIFMMQLCSGARHIEVQIVGDQPLESACVGVDSVVDILG